MTLLKTFKENILTPLEQIHFLYMPYTLFEGYQTKEAVRRQPNHIIYFLKDVLLKNKLPQPTWSVIVLNR
ncbi:hypothetical protein [Flavobacterium cheongpyeongense]|uniref:hypothetical protein n=1 Tax=Flavobacterium cheongpyeongense TaxID=2212651 RepID=UPI0014027489|nr:hypothetical protein [Flavobacterium cheongpyeongense]